MTNNQKDTSGHFAAWRTNRSEIACAPTWKPLTADELALIVPFLHHARGPQGLALSTQRRLYATLCQLLNQRQTQRAG